MLLLTFPATLQPSTANEVFITYVADCVGARSGFSRFKIVKRQIFWCCWGLIQRRMLSADTSFVLLALQTVSVLLSCTPSLSHSLLLQGLMFWSCKGMTWRKFLVRLKVSDSTMPCKPGRPYGDLYTVLTYLFLFYPLLARACCIGELRHWIVQSKALFVLLVTIAPLPWQTFDQILSAFYSFRMVCCIWRVFWRLDATRQSFCHCAAASWNVFFMLMRVGYGL